MIDKLFDEIGKSDIDTLINDQVSEIKQLEYKKELPGGTNKEKMEFLSDVSSFANASGGHIVYGLGDKKDAKGKNTGTPEYVGLGEINVDEQKLRLEQIAMNGIEPRIPGIQVKAVEGFDNGPVMIMRITQSWSSPHMVKHNNRFYSRTSSGKYPLDVHEIRAAFALSEALPERMKQFRADRLAKIVAGETPVKLNTGAKIVVHLIPFEAFARGKGISGALLNIQARELPPIYPSTGWTHRYNLDGLLTFEPAGDRSTAYTYVQVFRAGIIEALDTSIIQASGETKALSRGYELELLKSLEIYLKVMNRVGVTTPIFIMLSLLDVRGYRIGGVNNFSFGRRGQDPIDRDALIIPEVLLETFEQDLAEVMRGAFDVVWNAAGWPRSMNYDKDGKWVG